MGSLVFMALGFGSEVLDSITGSTKDLPSAWGVSDREIHGSEIPVVGR